MDMNGSDSDIVLAAATGFLVGRKINVLYCNASC